MNIDANLYVHPKNAQSAQRKDNVTCKSDCDFVLYSGSIEKLEATLVGFTLSKRNTDKGKKHRHQRDKNLERFTCIKASK